MDPQDLARLADPAVLGSYLAGLPRHAHGGGGGTVTLREDEYHGHKIVVKATYDVTIDGRPLSLHLSVTNDGSVHCHSLPNYQSTSLIDVLRHLIDAYPDDFPPGGGGGHSHGHGRPGGHGGHPSQAGGS
jgi:hypothetical protein